MKRVPELRDLSDDHHTGLVLALRCKRAATADPRREPDELWAELREAFASELEPHFRIEEQHLLPALEAIGEHALASRIREDHLALRALVASEAPSHALLGRFGEGLERHIRYEEREVFEPTQARLPARALEAIAAACEARKR